MGGWAYLDFHTQRRSVGGWVKDGEGEVGQGQSTAAVDVNHLVAAPPCPNANVNKLKENKDGRHSGAVNKPHRASRLGL